jgi:hypothetical protein
VRGIRTIATHLTASRKKIIDGPIAESRTGVESRFHDLATGPNSVAAFGIPHEGGSSMPTAIEQHPRLSSPNRDAGSNDASSTSSLVVVLAVVIIVILSGVGALVWMLAAARGGS